MPEMQNRELSIQGQMKGKSIALAAYKKSHLFGWDFLYLNTKICLLSHRFINQRSCFT